MPNEIELSADLSAPSSVEFAGELKPLSLLIQRPKQKAAEVEDDDEEDEPTYVGTTAGEIGSILGSQIGSAIAGKNVFARIAVNTVLSATLQTIGNSLDLLLNDKTGKLSAMGAWTEASADFGSNLAGAFQSQAIGAISGFLMGELSESMGLKGFGGGLFRTVGGSITSTVLNNAVKIAQSLGTNNPLSATSLFDGIGAALPTAIATFVGTYLASKIIAPKTQAGAIGSSLGSALGSALGMGVSGIIGGSTTLMGSIATGFAEAIGLTAFASAISSAAAAVGISTAVLGVILPGIGALIGAVLGTWLGNMIAWGGDEAYAWRQAGIGPGSTTMTLGAGGQDDGDFVQPMLDLANATIGAVNQVLEATGGKVHSTSNLTVQFFVWRDSQNKMGGSDVVTESSTIGDAADNSSVTTGYYNQSGGTRVEAATLAMLKRADLRGGNIYMKRALANTTATTLNQLYGELSIAQDYARYIENRGTIDAIIELQPESAFAAGWVITLIKAQELGLDVQNRTDFIGGMGEFLKSFGVERYGVGFDGIGFAVETIEGNSTLVLTFGGAARRYEIKDYETLAKLGVLTGGASVAGTTGNDIWFAAAGVNSTFTERPDLIDATSNDVLIGNTGHDTIYGGSGFDILQGRAGNDLIDGGTGDDLLDGGLGNDTLKGGSGDDDYVFGRGYGQDTIEETQAAVTRVEAYTAQQVTSQTWVSDGYWADGGEGGSYWVDTSHWNYTYANYTAYRALANAPEYQGASDKDTLRLGSGITAADLRAQIDGNHLLIGVLSATAASTATFADTVDQVKLENWKIAGTRIELIKFSDGSGWDQLGLVSWLTSQLTPAELGTITIQKTHVAEDLPALKARLDQEFGTVTLALENGALVFRVTPVGAAAGSVPHRIEIPNASTAFGRNLIAASATGALVRGGFTTDDLWVATDGVNNSYIDRHSLMSATQGLTDDKSNDLLFGASGNDTIDGAYGSDVIYGASGNDSLLGGSGDDFLDGEEGNDLLDGGTGNDVYTFGLASGLDTIRETQSATTRVEPSRWVEGHYESDGGEGQVWVDAHWTVDYTTFSSFQPMATPPADTQGTGRNDVLVFGEGVTLADLRVQFSGNHLVLGIATATTDTFASTASHRVTLNDWRTSSNRVEVLAFNDGTVLDELAFVSWLMKQTTATEFGTLSMVVQVPAPSTNPADDPARDRPTGALPAPAGHDELIRIWSHLREEFNAVELRLGANGTSLIFDVTSADNTVRSLEITNVATGLGLNGVLNTLGSLNRGTNGNDFWMAPDTSTMSLYGGATGGQSFTDQPSNLATGQGLLDNASNDILLGAQGNDTIDGGVGRDLIYGGLGNDSLTGGTGDDTLEGGAGNDTVDGGMGNDRILFGIGSGVDTVRDVQTNITTRVQPNGTSYTAIANPADRQSDGAGDTLVFGKGVTASMLRAKFVGNDLHIGIATVDTQTIDTVADKTILEGWRTTSTRVDRFEFESGATWDPLSIVAWLASLANISATDFGSVRLTAAQVKDTLPGLLDRLRSRYASVTPGMDTDGTSLTIDIVTADGVSRRIVIENAVAGFGLSNVASVTDSTLVRGTEKNDFWGAKAGYASQFSDTPVGLTDAQGLLDNLTKDILIGSWLNDTIKGGSGGDEIYGGIGNDQLFGGTGDDLLDGGAGNDMLDGGMGDDVYLFGRGYGQDEIRETQTNVARFEPYTSQRATTTWISDGHWEGSGEGAYWVDTSHWLMEDYTAFRSITGTLPTNLQGDGSKDTLRLGAGIAVSDLIFEQQGDDLLIRVVSTATLLQGSTAALAATDTIRLKDWTVAANKVELVEFANGQTLNLASVVTQASVPAGTSFAVQSLVGDVALGIRRMMLGGTAAANTITGTVAAELIAAGDGNDILDDGDGSDLIYGGAGNDLLYGRVGADIVDMGDGDDAIYDYDGMSGDHYIGGAGSDGLIYYGGNSFDFSGPNADRIDASIEWAMFDSASTVIGSAGADRLSGASWLDNADNISGRGGNDRLAGQGGNDTLDGGTGDDTIEGGAGNDVLIAGAGNDSLDGGIGTDLADYTGSTSAIELNMFTGAVTSTAGNDTLVGIEQVLGSGFADTMSGNHDANLLEGGGGNDQLYGNNGADTLRGGAGNDLFYGQEGSDLLDGGDGWDTADYAHTGGGIYVNLFDGSVAWSESDALVSVEQINGSAFADLLSGNHDANALEGRDGNDWLYGNGGNDTMLGGIGNDSLYGQGGDDLLDGGAGSDSIDGGDGWDTADYATTGAAITVNLFTGAVTGGDNDTLVSVEQVDGSAFADLMSGNHDANTLKGRDGNDWLFGNNGNDTLLGGAGDDSLYGQGDSDLLDGGAGDDSLEGATGSDTYKFGRGYGRDTIVEVADAATAQDKVELGVGIAENDIWLKQVGNNLEMYLRGTTDAIVLKDWYAPSAAQVETFNLGDGNILRAADVAGLVNAMAGYTPTTAGATIPPMTEAIPASVQTAISQAWRPN